MEDYFLYIEIPLSNSTIKGSHKLKKNKTHWSYPDFRHAISLQIILRFILSYKHQIKGGIDQKEACTGLFLAIQTLQSVSHKKKHLNMHYLTSISQIEKYF